MKTEREAAVHLPRVSGKEIIQEHAKGTMTTVNRTFVLSVRLIVVAKGAFCVSLNSFLAAETVERGNALLQGCLLYTSDAADE